MQIPRTHRDFGLRLLHPVFAKENLPGLRRFDHRFGGFPFGNRHQLYVVARTPRLFTRRTNAFFDDFSIFFYAHSLSRTGTFMSLLHLGDQFDDQHLKNQLFGHTAGNQLLMGFQKPLAADTQLFSSIVFCLRSDFRNAEPVHFSRISR